MRVVAAALAAALVLTLTYVAFTAGGDRVDTEPVQALTTSPPPSIPVSPAPTAILTSPAPSPTAAARPASPTPRGVSGRFTLARAEEFTGNKLDRRLWTTKEPWNGPPGLTRDQSFCPLPAPSSLVDVEGGSLKLKAVPQAAGGKPVQACFVTTRGNLDFTHGFIEARVKLPTGADLWPAFWLLGNGTNSTGCPWPCTGEIDIFEFVNNGGGNGVPFFTTHWAGPCNQWNHCSKTQSDPYPPKVSGWGKDWVTFGLHRTEDEITVYIDGKRSHGFKRGARQADGKVLDSKLFDDPMHIRFDLSAGDWAEDPSKPAQAGTFEIDYLRVWKRP